MAVLLGIDCCTELNRGTNPYTTPFMQTKPARNDSPHLPVRADRGLLNHPQERSWQLGRNFRHAPSEGGGRGQGRRENGGREGGRETPVRKQACATWTVQDNRNIPEERFFPNSPFAQMDPP